MNSIQTALSECNIIAFLIPRPRHHKDDVSCAEIHRSTAHQDKGLSRSDPFTNQSCQQVDE